MHKVFISYRRSDAAFPAGALARELRQRLGEDQIFRDQEDIQGGVSWRSHVLAEIKADSVLLVLIGERWLEPAAGQKGSRLSDAADPVRMEILDGMKDGATIIPILLEGAKMPGMADLPPELHGLCDLNALKLRDGDWQHDVERLCRTLNKAGFEPAQPPAAATTSPVSTSLLSWKPVVAALLSIFSLLGIYGPTDSDQQAGSLVFVCAALVLTIWAWYDIRRGRCRNTWLTAGSSFFALTVLPFVYWSETTSEDLPEKHLTQRADAQNSSQTLPTEVEEAYLAMVRAYNERDAHAYEEAFADPMLCFYQQRSAPSAMPGKRIETGAKLRVTARDLSLLSQSESEVAFCDHGRFERPDGRIIDTAKTIVMTRQQGRWKVDVEVGPGAGACYRPRCQPKT